MQTQIDGLDIEIKQGDITEQEDCEAIVNAANAELTTGGGVAGAIHKKAGPELDEICRPLAPIRPGKAVITKACNLPNDYVIHCLGPIYGSDKPEDKLLMSCYKEAMKLAEENNISSIAFPALSTGAFGYPIADATPLIKKAISEEASKLKRLKKIRFVLFSENDKDVYEGVFND